MLIVRCTQKLLKNLDVTKDQLVANGVISAFPLGNWHANVISVSRYRGIIFVNDPTLFSFVVFHVPKAKLRNNFTAIFNRVLCNILQFEGFSTEWIRKVKEANNTFMFGNSVSRRVLGTINDLIKHYQYDILVHGGAKQCNFQETICEMNRIPQKNLNWNYAIEEMKRLAN